MSDGDECVDKNVEGLIALHRQRVKWGIKKYGVTTDRDDFTAMEWVQHAKEEAMDFAVYLNKIQRDFKGLLELPLRHKRYESVVEQVVEGREPAFNACVPFNSREDAKRFLAIIEGAYKDAARTNA